MVAWFENSTVEWEKSMKKNTTGVGVVKRLFVNKEAIRSLSVSTLLNVGGGAIDLSVACYLTNGLGCPQSGDIKCAGL